LCSDKLSFAAAILAVPSIMAIGLSLLIESYGNLSVKLPNFLVNLRTKMAENRGKWNTIEFWLKVAGFIGVLIAIGLQIASLSIRIW
jgi:hypothetical protein